MITKEELNRLHDMAADVMDVEGYRIGRLKELYLDGRNQDPSWATVKTGLFGMSETFVPLAAATVIGDDIRVPYTLDQVKEAPRIEPEGRLEPADEERLYRHYALAADTDMDIDRTGAAANRDAIAHGSSGPATDDAMTLSEERVNVGTEREEVGRARLRKYIVTETETRTVPVSHEEVRIEREPITEASGRDALAGPDLGEQEHEVTLHAERPVVDKETVPVERVRLHTENVTDRETVTEEVRKEEITLDTDTDPRQR